MGFTVQEHLALFIYLNTLVKNPLYRLVSGFGETAMN